MISNELSDFSKKFIKDRFMAVVSCVSNGEPRSFTCWYVVVDGNIYWKSRTTSVHSTAFALNPKASLCIYDHNASYPDDKTGVQVLGEVYKVTDRNEMSSVLDKLTQSFGEKVTQKNKLEDLCDPNTNSTFYAFVPNRFKLVCKDFDVHMEEYEDFSL